MSYPQEVKPPLPEPLKPEEIRALLRAAKSGTLPPGTKHKPYTFPKPTKSADDPAEIGENWQNMPLWGAEPVTVELTPARYDMSVNAKGKTVYTLVRATWGPGRKKVKRICAFVLTSAEVFRRARAKPKPERGDNERYIFQRTPMILACIYDQAVSMGWKPGEEGAELPQEGGEFEDVCTSVAIGGIDTAATGDSDSL